MQGADYNKLERNEAKRIGAKQHKNSGLPVCYNHFMKYGERKLNIGDVSPQGKMVVGINSNVERHRGYKLKCTNCGHITDTSIKSFNNRCRKCNPVRSNTIPIEAHLWHRYKHSAKSRGILFDISLKRFSEIIKLDCMYCGSPPSQKLVVSRKVDNSLVYNGVDRLICERGYTGSNCVPCCWPCNQAKRDWPVDVFHGMVREWAKRCENWTTEV